jgi:hypothetical protein
MMPARAPISDDQVSGGSAAASQLSGDRLFRVRDLVAHLAFEGPSLS